MAKSRNNAFTDPVSRALIRRVLRENFGLYAGRYFLAFGLMVVTAAATGFSAYLMKVITTVVFGKPEKVITQVEPKDPDILDRLQETLGGWLSSWLGSSNPGLRTVFLVSLTILFVFVLKGLTHYGSTVILARIGNNLIARQQTRISRHILKQSLDFFVHFPSSDLVTRVSRAASSTKEVMHLLMTRVQDVLTAIALLTTMFVLDWKLSCIAFFVMSPISFGLARIVARVKKIARSEYRVLSQVISALQEGILGIKLIKSFNLEPHMHGRFDEAINAVEERANKLVSVSARTGPMMEIMGAIVIALVVFYGGYRNLVLNQSADNLFAFLTALLLAYEPIKRLAKMNVSLATSLVGVQMLYELLDADYQLDEDPAAKPLKVHQGQVVLDRVTFAYHPENPVLRDISLTCPGGSVTALVGPSGSGKSTILNLIERFYRSQEGHILIDGQDTRHVTTRSLRDAISLVSQDTFLFSDTLRNNIRYGRPDATDQEIEAAAKAAFAHDFILAQPDGYDTQVGENGGSLSGGQRQRISIARAFLKNAPILLLDEATSALDSESEQNIQAAFDHLMQGRTTIVIAHRFSTIRNAKTIHVMQDGKLVASGSHHELIRDPQGLYAHLHRLQYQEH
jgi:ATP-binding cassette subfamily B protein